MKPRVLTSRLLPATIGMLAVVLAAKTTVLVQSVIVRGQPATMIAGAWANGPGAQPAAEKPGAKPAEHGQPAKSEREAEKKSGGPDARASAGQAANPGCGRRR